LHIKPFRTRRIDSGGVNRRRTQSEAGESAKGGEESKGGAEDDHYDDEENVCAK